MTEEQKKRLAEVEKTAWQSIQAANKALGLFISENESHAEETPQEDSASDAREVVSLFWKMRHNWDTESFAHLVEKIEAAQE